MAGTQGTTDSPHLVAPSFFGHADVGHDKDKTESRKGIQHLLQIQVSTTRNEGSLIRAHLGGLKASFT